MKRWWSLEAELRELRRRFNLYLSIEKQLNAERGASRGETRRELDARQEARLVRLREAHARLSKDFKGKALSREIRKALADVYLGRDGLWRADLSRVNSRPIPELDDE